MEKEKILNQTYVELAEQDKLIKIAVSEAIAEALEIKKDGQIEGQKHQIERIGKALDHLKVKNFNKELQTNLHITAESTAGEKKIIYQKLINFYYLKVKHNIYIFR